MFNLQPNFSSSSNANNCNSNTGDIQNTTSTFTTEPIQTHSSQTGVIVRSEIKGEEDLKAKMKAAGIIFDENLVQFLTSDKVGVSALYLAVVGMKARCGICHVKKFEISHKCWLYPAKCPGIHCCLGTF